VIKIRRVPTSLPLVRRYDLELPGGPGDLGGAERLTARRGEAVRRLEKIVGVGDAWSFINEADRQWSAGNRSWAVEFDETPPQS
jgi:hypothetical protein